LFIKAERLWTFIFLYIVRRCVSTVRTKSGVLFIHPAKIDVEICSHCGGAVKVIACIEDQQVIDKILTHLKKKDRLPLPPDSKTHIWP